MKLHRWAAAAAVSLAVGGACQAFDSIKMAKSTMMGRVVSISPVAVEIEPSSGGANREIPVNQIQMIYFEDDPVELKTAKSHVLGGRYADAQAALERIKDEVPRREIQQDIDFYRALCAAKLALVGNGTIAEAGRMMKAFADANPKSCHYFDASEIVGDLLVAIRLYAQAAEYYGRLDKAPWADYRMRAGVAAGRALLAQGKIVEAQAAFDRVIVNDTPGDLAESQRLMAKLGKASGLSASKKHDEAIKLIDEILKTADPEDASLLARAYVVLGNSQRQAGHVKEALLAFLHVDLLYPALPDAHAEALANLAELWEQVHKSERAVQARRILMEDYKDSAWAKKLEKEAVEK